MLSDILQYESKREGSRSSLLSRTRLETTLLWLTFALSALVWIEPAPFDFLCLILFGVWLTGGMRLSDDFRWPLVLLGVLTISGLLAAFLSTAMIGSGRHILITVFLYLITIGLAAHVARDPNAAIPTMVNGYTVAAIVAVVAGIAGYFSFSDGAHELFTERERARGTFKDPNVFGPFLVLPIVYGFVRHMIGECRFGGLQTWVVAFLCFGLLLSFSRGAWGNFAVSLGLSIYLLLVSSNSNVLRIKVVVLTLVAGILAIAGILFALSFDAVAEMMDVRGHLIQSYDTQERFVGAQVALDVILKNPLGIGALGFTRFHHAEPHNVYLYNFIIGGWLGGFAYIALVGYTIYLGLQVALVQAPLRVVTIVIVSVFIATALEGLIVDTDHWRHFYVLMACIWGLRSYVWSSDAVGVEQRQGGQPSADANMRDRIAHAASAAAARVREQIVMRPPSSDVAVCTIRKDVIHEGRQLLAAEPTAKVVSEMRTLLQSRRGLLTDAAAARRAENKALRNAPRLHELPGEDRHVFGVRASQAVPDRTMFGRRPISPER